VAVSIAEYQAAFSVSKMQAVCCYEVRRQIQESFENLKSDTRKIGLFKCRVVEVCVHVASHSFSILSDDRSNASSKTGFPHSAI
jgi:hypothetical protein